MKKLLRKFRRRKLIKNEKHFSIGYDRGYEDGQKARYDKGRLSRYGVCMRVTTLEVRVERLDILITKLRTRGAGAEREHPLY